jgi:hypothetical protein
VRDGLAALRREGREIRRQEARTATGLWHAKGRLREWLAYELCAAGFCFQQLRYTSSLWRGEGSRSAAQEHKRCFRGRAGGGARATVAPLWWLMLREMAIVTGARVSCEERLWWRNKDWISPPLKL